MSETRRPKSVGARVQRLEDPRLLAGRGRFTDDHRVPVTLHLAFRRSEEAHARIRAIDTATAAAMPGVVAVFTAADLAGEIRPVRAESRMRDYYATAFVALAADKVRYVGEAIAVVAAESRYLAEDAAAEIEVDFKSLPPLGDTEAALAEGAALLHDEAGTNVIARREFKRGEVEEALFAAPHRVGGRFRMHRKTPAAIENRAYLAEFDPGRGHLTVHSATQVPGLIRDALAEILDLPGSRLRVVAGDVGGGFGGKASLYPEEVVVAALARRLEATVKWTGDRLEDLTTTSQAFDEVVEAELAFDGAGRLLGLVAEVVGDVGAYSIYPWTASLEPVQVISFLPGPYRLPAYRGAVRAVATNKPPMGPYRGVGRPVSVFVMERLIDMAASELGLDPVEMRRRNLVAEDEFPYRAGSGLMWDRSGFHECLEAAVTQIDYTGRRAAQSAGPGADGRLFGIGVASYAELTGIGSRISAAPGMPINTGTEMATIQLDSTGAVRAAFGIASHGQGLETTLAQVIADELGVAPAAIEIVQGDSAAVPHGTGTYASRSTVLAGGAAILSARGLRERIVQVAALLFEASADDIEITDGIVAVAGTDRRLSFRELAKAFYSEMGRLPREARDELALEVTRVYDPFFGTTTSATHIAVVAVDPEICEIEVLDYAVAEDCGRIINPGIVDGQVHGGVAQGIGAALFEEIRYDANGQCLTGSFVDYVVPSAAEIPALHVTHVESVLPATEGGFRGMGEGGTIGATGAIANAVTDALRPLGIEIMELPVTPERLFRLIRDANAKTKERDET